MKKLFALFFISALLFNLSSSHFVGNAIWPIKSLSAIHSFLPTLILSLCFVYFLLKVDLKNKVSLFTFLFISAFFVHYRHDVFFYFDEWTLLNVFQDSSILTYHHNEHYLPLFFSFLKLETKIFGMHYQLYLLVSILLHTLNTFLVYDLSLDIFEKQVHRKLLAKIIAVLFMLSSLHSEALHWAFEQSLLICATLILVSVRFARRYFHNGDKVALVTSLTAACLSPFVFGNGFSVPIILLLFWLLDYPDLQFARLRNLLSPIILWFGVCALFYFSNSPQPAAEIDNQIARTLAYIFSGSQLGVVLRGLGLYPTLELDAAPKLLATFPFSKVREFPEVSIACLGFFISLASLLLTFRYKHALSKIWLIGFLLPIATIILPALTRWHYGSAQALSLRYSYLGVFGLFLMLSPCILMLIENSKSRLFLGLILTSNIYLQLCLSKDFRYFSNYGIRHRDYVEKLIAWKCTGSRMPRHLATISPGFNQDLIYKAVTWLDQNHCD